MSQAASATRGWSRAGPCDVSRDQMGRRDPHPGLLQLLHPRVWPEVSQDRQGGHDEGYLQEHRTLRSRDPRQGQQWPDAAPLLRRGRSHYRVSDLNDLHLSDHWALRRNIWREDEKDWYLQASDREHYGTVTGAMVSGSREGLRLANILASWWILNDFALFYFFYFFTATIKVVLLHPNL